MIKLLEDYEVRDLFNLIDDPEILGNLIEDTTQVTANTLPALLLRTSPGTVSTAFAIYSDGELAGVVTINNISLIKRSAFIGFIAVGRGFKSSCGLNAARYVIKHCFETLGMNRVYGHTWSDNERMDAFYKRLGATLDGIEREHTFKNGQFVDMKIWSILRGEYYGKTD